MTPSKLAFLILEAKNLEDLQQTVRNELIKERIFPPGALKAQMGELDRLLPQESLKEQQTHS